MTMTDSPNDIRSVVIVRELRHPPEKVWRALTRPELIADWLMESDFRPEIDHRFRFAAAWGAVDCQVLRIEPERLLSYTWQAQGLETVVTWTLEPTSAGTRLRMEQSGFRADQARAYGGAKGGWPRFLDSLEAVLARQ
jgi:uncharacterized protein YndB with AHSA1/START domain